MPIFNDESLWRQSARTAIARSAPSWPARTCLEAGYLRGRVLHLGAGRPENPDRALLDSLGAVHHDPHYGPALSAAARRGFDSVCSFYVLNVLPAQVRQGALVDLARAVAEGGQALVAVRSVADITAARRASWAPYGDGFAVPRGASASFQRGYSPLELWQELSGFFAEIELLPSPSHVVLARATAPLARALLLPGRGGTLAGQKLAAGKIIGGALYVHRSAAPEFLAERIERCAREVPFTWAALRYDPRAETLRFDEAPGFDAESEPSVGRFCEFSAEGAPRLGQSASIWHHKWLWVAEEYAGFDVAASRRWSRFWYARLAQAASGSLAAWARQSAGVRELYGRGVCTGSGK